MGVSMKLYLAEKHSLGEAIAAGLGNPVPGQGKIVCGDDVVSWCAGHLLEEYMPADYDPAYEKWEMEVLPIVPSEWKNKPKSTAGKQLGVIRDLLKKAGSVVNCGDPDREGQVLVDEVLEHFRYGGSVERLWLDDGLTPQAVKKALGKMKDNQSMAPLRDAARARSRADWLVGLNATRAMTLKGKAAGLQGKLPVGRVQTPTLSLVVARDRAIENFKPYPFYVLKAEFKHPQGSFWATFKPSGDDTEGFDDGRLIDKARAEAICGSVRGASGSIVKATTEEKKSSPPLAYSLSVLSKAASSKYGMTAKQVLDAAQALYLAKLTSYPRTNCRYLPEDQQVEGATILKALASLSGRLARVAQIASQADPALKSPAWNSAKQTAHHGIIPTGELPAEDLPVHQQQLYELICTNYALQFHPPMVYQAQEIQVVVNGAIWNATGKIVLSPGWTSFSSNEDEEKEEDPPASGLPKVQQGDCVDCTDVQQLEKMTSPPAHFTDGTLLDAMENVHRYVSADASMKNTLKKTKGIGTDATRASIIEGLLKNGLLSMEGKKIVSTPLGRQLIDLVPAHLKDPLTTAEWESKLEEIAEGRYTLEDFLRGICMELPNYIEAIKSLTISSLAESYPCPVCQEPLKRVKCKDGKIRWACFNTEKHDGKAYFLDDKAGKPLVQKEYPCPVCQEPLKRMKCKDGKIRWACFNTEKHDGKAYFLDDKAGKPVARKEYPCPECKSPLVRRASSRKAGEFYWACFCKEKHEGQKVHFFADKKGRPDLEGGKK